MSVNAVIDGRAVGVTCGLKGFGFRAAGGIQLVGEQGGGGKS